MSSAAVGGEGSSVWLVLDSYSFQGVELLGIYTTPEAARLAMESVGDPGGYVEIRQLPLNEAIDEWMGN